MPDDAPPAGTAAADRNVAIKLYPDADGRVGHIEVNDRQGVRLGALTQGASGFRSGRAHGGARFAAVPLVIAARDVQRDRGFVRELHTAQTVRPPIVTEQRALRRANPGLNGIRNRPGGQPNQQRPNGAPGQNRPGQPQQGTPNGRQGTQQPGTQQPGNRQQPTNRFAATRPTRTASSAVTAGPASTTEPTRRTRPRLHNPAPPTGKARSSNRGSARNRPDNPRGRDKLRHRARRSGSERRNRMHRDCSGPAYSVRGCPARRAAPPPRGKQEKKRY